MGLQNKISGACELITQVMSRANRPAIMSSFGKDSMVLMHLIRARGYELPIIFHREPFMPHKYQFANGIIRDWNLTVYDFPPQGTAVQSSDDCMEVVNYYTAGARSAVLPTGICEPIEGETALCGLHDLYLKPVGGFAYPWDYVFHGHKSSDHDPIYGDVPLLSDIGHNIGSASAAFPLRHFTDEDVWAYHEEFDLPIHHERYHKLDGVWQEREDKTHNPDYFPACTACMKPNGGPVSCPRMGGQIISNVSTQLRWAKRENVAYMQSNGAT